MGKITLDDFIHLLFNYRVELNEKSSLTPKHFFNGVSKNKCNYRIGKRVPALDYGYQYDIFKKEYLPSEENIKKEIDNYDDSHNYQIIVDIPPMKSCIKHFFGNMVEYDDGYNPQGNHLAYDYKFMLTMPVNLPEVPSSITKRFSVGRSYHDDALYAGTQYYFRSSRTKRKMEFTKYKQIIRLSHGAQYYDDSDYEQLAKDIRFCKLVCKDHSKKLLVSRASDLEINQYKVYAGSVFKALSKIC